MDFIFLCQLVTITESLYLEVKPEIDPKKDTIHREIFQTVKECGDYNANMPAVRKVDQFCGDDIKNKKTCRTDNVPADIPNGNKSNSSENSEKQLELPQNADGNIPNANSPSNCSTEAKSDKKVCVHIKCRKHDCKVYNNTKEIQSSHIEYASKEIQHPPDKENADTLSLVEHKDISHTNCSSQSECKLIKCKRKAALDSVNRTLTESDVKSVSHCTKVFSSHPSGGVQTKCNKMTSRIPRTKSYTEGKSKCTLVERTPTEGTSVGNTQCLKRCQKGVTYRTIHQRNKSPKGDSVTQL